MMYKLYECSNSMLFADAITNRLSIFIKWLYIVPVILIVYVIVFCFTEIKDEQKSTIRKMYYIVWLLVFALIANNYDYNSYTFTNDF